MALARLRAIQGDRSGCWKPEDPGRGLARRACYAQALRHQLSLRHCPDDRAVWKDAYTWLAQSGIEFDELEVIGSVDPVNRIFRDATLARRMCWHAWRKGRPGRRACTRLRRLRLLEAPDEFAKTHGIPAMVEVAIARTCSIRRRGRSVKRSRPLRRH